MNASRRRNRNRNDLRRRQQRADDAWQALLAGKSGVERITSFDASQFACQIAAEVKNFDPLQYIDKKEARKMARFIHVAIAAADEALQHGQLQG